MKTARGGNSSPRFCIAQKKSCNRPRRETKFNAHNDDVEQRLKFLRLPIVLEQTGLSRSALYRLVATHEFPQRSSAWVEAEVSAWKLNKVHQ